VGLTYLKTIDLAGVIEMLKYQKSAAFLHIRVSGSHAYISEKLAMAESPSSDGLTCCWCQPLTISVAV
jgi:hypothetical protein